MKRIKINPDQLITEARGFKRSAERLAKLGQELYDAFHSIEIEYSGLSKLNSLMINEIQQARQLSSRLETLSGFLANSAAALEDSDKNAANGLGNVEKINIVIDNRKTDPRILPIVTLPWIARLIEKPVTQDGSRGEGNGVWPTPNRQISPNYKGHTGIDFRASKIGVQGDPIKSVLSGKVEFAGLVNQSNAPCKGLGQCDSCNLTRNIGCSYGNAVYITTEINGIKYQLRYAHLMKDSILVQKGQEINVGTQIAKMGNTGYSTGAHLHFEVRKYNANGKLSSEDINEMEFLKMVGVK